jgi:hypothetical protein
MNFDLNIDNYKQHELEEIFQLPKKFDNKLLETQELKLRQNILLDGSVSTFTKTKMLTFITNAKDTIFKNSNKNSIENPVELITSIYNLNADLKPSELTADGGQFIITPAKTPYAQSMPSEFYQGVINPLNKRIIKQSLNIDTRFRENYYSTLSTNFHVDLPLKFSNVVSMQLAAMEFPSSFYNISKIFGNNFFSIKIDDITEIISIPDGNYKYDSLTNYINVFLSSLTNANFNTLLFTCDISDQSGSGKMIVSSSATSHVSFILDFQTDKFGQEDRLTPLPLKLGWMMGFRNGQYINNETYVSEGIVDLIGIRYLYLVVNDFNNNVNDGFYAAFNASILNKNILARISLQGAVFSYQSENNFSLITNARQYFGPVDIQKLQIQLLDEYGRIIDMNNMDYSFCMTFQTVYDL